MKAQPLCAKYVRTVYLLLLVVVLVLLVLLLGLASLHPQKEKKRICDD